MTVECVKSAILHTAMQLCQNGAKYVQHFINTKSRSIGCNK